MFLLCMLSTLSLWGYISAFSLSRRMIGLDALPYRTCWDVYIIHFKLLTQVCCIYCFILPFLLCFVCFFHLFPFLPFAFTPTSFLFGFHFIPTQICRCSFNLADNLRMCLFRHLAIVLASCMCVFPPTFSALNVVPSLS